MLKTIVNAGGMALSLCAATAFAATAPKWVPASEILGQTVQVETNGTVNDIQFVRDGTAVISTPGGRTIPATWTATKGQLCLGMGGAHECWNYPRPFQEGQSLTMTSDCNVTSRWLVRLVNPAPPKPDAERG